MFTSALTADFFSSDQLRCIRPEQDDTGATLASGLSIYIVEQSFYFTAVALK